MMACYSEMEQKVAQRTNTKFQTEVMNCGTLDDFANGLSNRVGEQNSLLIPLVLMHRP